LTVWAGAAAIRQRIKMGRLERISSRELHRKIHEYIKIIPEHGADRGYVIKLFTNNRRPCRSVIPAVISFLNMYYKSN
jgi:hypothetical protein